jgi:hypothetical protein
MVPERAARKRRRVLEVSGQAARAARRDRVIPSIA